MSSAAHGAIARDARDLSEIPHSAIDRADAAAPEGVTSRLVCVLLNDHHRTVGRIDTERRWFEERKGRHVLLCEAIVCGGDERGAARTLDGVEHLPRRIQSDPRRMRHRQNLHHVGARE